MTESTELFNSRPVNSIVISVLIFLGQETGVPAEKPSKHGKDQLWELSHMKYALSFFSNERHNELTACIAPPRLPILSSLFTNSSKLAIYSLAIYCMSDSRDCVDDIGRFLVTLNTETFGVQYISPPFILCLHLESSLETRTLDFRRLD